MLIKILSWGSKDWEYNHRTYNMTEITSKLSKMGLEYKGYAGIYGIHNVTDNQLFMLSVIKYGIVFEEINCSV